MRRKTHETRRGFNLIRMISGLKFAILIAGTASLLLLPCRTGAQVPNHTFPRTAIWQWSGAPEEWYAKFDLAFTRPKSASFISKVKQLNSNIIFLEAKDINKSYEGIAGFPDEWYLYDSKGNRIELYGAGEYWTNLSDVCPRVNGEQLADFLPGYYADMVRDADGFATDGLYYKAHLTWRMFDDVDMDRNGVNDLDEHGKNWVIDHWAAGVDRLLKKLREKLGDKIILINTGSPDTPGKQWVNGYVSEHETSAGDWGWSRLFYGNLMQEVYKPPIFLMQNNPDSKDPRIYRPTKDFFRFVRFGLARATLLGLYYEFEDIDHGSNEHYWNRYYDEFDLELGYPTGGMREVLDGVWVRFFDHGAVILNISGRSVEVTDADLQAVSGYAGPYYRFRGGQDPRVNNGERFTSVQLDGHTFNGYNDDFKIMGDALFLVKSPRAVVAEIIIDNVDMGTSPGSNPVHLSGSFQQEENCDSGSRFFSLRCSWNPGTFPYAVAYSGTGRAEFIPQIGLGGQYAVYEWHGRLPGTQASNVQYIISHAGGTTTRTVNQKANQGRWNYLGTYGFKPGNSGKVTITTNGADGPVMADAVKFVYQNPDAPPIGETDIHSPAPPANVRVRSQD